MLMTPDRSVIASPSAARASGTPSRTEASRKRTSAASDTAERGLRMSLHTLEREHGEYHERLDGDRPDGRHGRIPLHGCRAGVERTEEHAGRQYAEGMQPRQQGDGDRRVTPTRGEALVECVGHARHLDAS